MTFEFIGGPRFYNGGQWSKPEGRQYRISIKEIHWLPLLSLYTNTTGVGVGMETNGIENTHLERDFFVTLRVYKILLEEGAKKKQNRKRRTTNIKYNLSG